MDSVRRIGLGQASVELVAVLPALVATAVTLLFGFTGTWRALGQKPAPLLRNE